MADVIDLAAFRRKSDAKTVADAAPSEHVSDSGLVQIRRVKAIADLNSALSTINERICEFEKLEYAGEASRQQLLAEQPQIDQFHALCPPSTHPYSGQLSQSMAMLTTEQAQSIKEMMERLKALAEQLAHKLRVAKDITRLQDTTLKLRRTVAPRTLRQADWDDPDLGLCQLIDYAADPYGFLARCDLLLGQAKIALNEERVVEAYPGINEAEQITAYLHAVGTAMVHGALVECGG